MARCSNDAVFQKVIEKKLENRTEVHLSLHKELPDCRNIKADDYVEVITSAEFYKTLKPKSVYECFPKDCVTTGTLAVSKGTGSNATVTYFVPDPSQDWANGVITFYWYAHTSGLSMPQFIVAIIDPNDDSNTAGYQISPAMVGSPVEGQFYPVFLDLSSATPLEESTFTAGETGALIEIIAPASDSQMWISSISVFDSIYDFELDDEVILSCLSSVGGSMDYEMIEATCMEKGHMQDPTSFEYPVTAKAITTNAWKLNPMNKKGDAVEGFEPHVVKMTIQEQGTTGVVRIYDMADECGFISAQLVDCNPFDGELKRLSVPSMVALDEDQYIVGRSDDGSVTFVFNKILVGREVLISYPRITHVDRIEGTTDEMNTVRTRMSVPVKYTVGDNTVMTEVHVFHNVWVTSFPTTITSEETEKAYTFTFLPDENGKWYHIDRIKSYRQTAIDTGSGDL